MTSIGQDFVTELLKITLNEQEHRMALILSIYYPVQIQKPMLMRAISCHNIAFLRLAFSSDLFLKRHKPTLASANGSPTKNHHPRDSGISQFATRNIRPIEMEMLVKMLLNFRGECIDLMISDERVVGTAHGSGIKQRKAQVQSD